MPTYTGGCHCGAVRYTAELDLERGTIRCNCSLCSKSRAWLTMTPAENFALERGSDNLSTYRWTPEGRAEANVSYRTCATCGVRTHAEGVAPDGVRTVAIQVATIENVDREMLAQGIRYVDGLHDRFDREPDDTRLL